MPRSSQQQPISHRPHALETISEPIDFQQYLENKAYIPVQMAGDEIKLVPRHLVNAAHIPVAASPAMAAWAPGNTASSQRIKTLKNRVEQLETLIKTQTALLIELSKKVNQEP